MENHPIPQDVTGFQFKLIGSMTLKQFALLGIPVVAAFLIYYSVFPFYIKYPLIFILSITGLSLAFVPIEGRPADVMIKHFINALFAPNQFLYEKQGRVLAFAMIDLKKAKQQAMVNVHRDNKKQLQLQTYLQNTSASNNPLDMKEAAFLQVLQKYSPAPSLPTPVHKSSPFGMPIHLPKIGFPSFGGTNTPSTSSGHIPSASFSSSQDKNSPFHPIEHDSGGQASSVTLVNDQNTNVPSTQTTQTLPVQTANPTPIQSGQAISDADMEMQLKKMREEKPQSTKYNLPKHLYRFPLSSCNTITCCHTYRQPQFNQSQ